MAEDGCAGDASPIRCIRGLRAGLIDCAIKLLIDKCMIVSTEYDIHAFSDGYLMR